MREGDKSFNALVIPQALTEYVLHELHDALGHNGTARTSLLLESSEKRHKYSCETMCKMQTTESVTSILCMIKFSSASGTNTFYSYGFNRKVQTIYHLTLLDMLTNDTWCIPFHTKET